MDRRETFSEWLERERRLLDCASRRWRAERRNVLVFWGLFFALVLAAVVFCLVGLCRS